MNKVLLGIIAVSLLVIVYVLLIKPKTDLIALNKENPTVTTPTTFKGDMVGTNSVAVGLATGTITNEDVASPPASNQLVSSTTAAALAAKKVACTALCMRLYPFNKAKRNECLGKC